jgi:hypothetical protein
MSRTIDVPLEIPGESLTSDRSLMEQPVAETMSDSSYEPDYLMPELMAEPRWYRWTWVGAAVVIVALFAGLVLRFWAGGDSGVDQNAYLVGGRLLAEHGSMKYVLPNPYSYVGGMFVRMTPPSEMGGVYYPKYPFGLPLLYALFFWGFKAAAAMHLHVNPAQAAYWAFLVSPISAIAAVAGMFFLGRQVAGSFAAALCAVLLGTSQLMLMLADNPNSHAACVAFIVWGMYFLVRWMQSGATWHGIVGGLLVGYAATIRYSEILLFVAMCVIVLSRLPWNQFKTYRSIAVVLFAAIGVELLMLRHDSIVDVGVVPLSTMVGKERLALLLGAIVLFAAAAGALAWSVLRLSWPDWRMYIRAIVPGLAWSVPVGTLLLVNYHTMGSMTGYDSTHESEFGAAFQWQFFFANWEKVVRVFYDLGLFFVVPFAIAGIFMLFRRSWRLGALLLAWVVPGVMLYMAYYWSPDRADAYARFFLTFLPALLVGVAVCIHDGILAGEKALGSFEGAAPKITAAILICWLAPGTLFYIFHYLLRGHVDYKAQALLIYLPAGLAVAAMCFHDVPLMIHSGRQSVGRIPLTVAAGIVVAIASGISVYRTIHGLRDGSDSTKIPLDDFRERLALSQTGQMMLDHNNVPAGSVVFTESSGGIANTGNYLQFVGDWEMFPVDAFSYDGSRRGFGGGGGGGRRNGGGRNGGGRNGRFNGGGGFNGGPGGPGGGPPGGGMGGGGGGGLFGNQNDTTTVTATPVQPEEREYHEELYKNKTARQLYQMESDLIQKAFTEGRRVFVVVGTEQAGLSSSRGEFFGRDTSDPLATFKSDLSEAHETYRYKTIAQWQDVSLPPEEEQDTVSNNPWANMGGGGGRNGGAMNRLFLAANRVLNWKLVEVEPYKRK